jgi:myosin heavy subunit
MNPYKKLDFNTEKAISLYKNNTTKELEPHVFEIANKALQEMKREQRDQSIILT